MSISTTKDLTDRQEAKLIALLERVEAATSATEAVWLDEEGREDIREIRKTIEE